MADRLIDASHPLSMDERKKLIDLIRREGPDSPMRQLYVRSINSAACSGLPTHNGTVTVNPVMRITDEATGHKEPAFELVVTFPAIEAKRCIPERLMLRALGDAGQEKHDALAKFDSEIEELGRMIVKNVKNVLKQGEEKGVKARKKRRKMRSGLVLVRP